MNYSIKIDEPFRKEIKRLSKKYNSLKKDLILLQEELYNNPTAGIDLGDGIRKIRMAISDKGRGKSHGARIISVTILLSTDNSEINLLYIYDKAERENITKNEIENLMKKVGLK